MSPNRSGSWKAVEHVHDDKLRLGGVRYHLPELRSVVCLADRVIGVFANYLDTFGFAVFAAHSDLVFNGCFTLFIG